jgi:hypothetical protein
VPSNARLLGFIGYGRGSQSATGWSYRFETTEPLRAVSDGYTAKLAQQGWRIAVTQITPTLVLTRFSAGSESDPQVGLLAVMSLPAPRMILTSVRLVRSHTPWRGTGRVSADGGTELYAPPMTPASVQRALDQMLTQADARGRREAFELQPRAPSSFPRELLPPQTQVRRAGVGYITTAVVGTVPRFGAADISAFGGRLRSAGWTEQFATHGFLADRTVFMNLCGDSRTAVLEFVIRPGADAFLKASATSRPGAFCERAPAGRLLDSQIPVLLAPASTRIEPRNGNSTSDARIADARLETFATTSQLAQHFESQLAAAGWRTEGRAGDAVHTTLRLVSRSPSVPGASGLLVLTSMPGAREVDAALTVVRHTAR